MKFCQKNYETGKKYVIIINDNIIGRIELNMNQILTTKKLYVTPELKRKKKIYKVDFIVSVFLVIALISFYLYAAYSRAKDEGVAKDILTSLNVEEEGDTSESDKLIVALDEAAEKEKAEKESKQNGGATKTKKRKTVRTPDGREYTSVATVYIPTLNVKYPVLLPSEQSTEAIEALLKVSPCKFWGPEVNEVGNFCIVGHNYRNTKFFSKVPTLTNGDVIQVTGVEGTTVNYQVYDKYTVQPEDVACTSQLTNGRKEVTLITCTDDSSLRWIVKAREIK